MKQVDYEPGLLSVFRIYVGARLVFSVLSLLAGTLAAESRIQRILPLPSLGVIESVLLLGYLSWPWLRQKLGGAYLPIALAIATLAPALELFLGIDLSSLDQATEFIVLAGQWQLVFFLFFPLILISWQYNFRVVIGYTLGLAVLDVIITAPLWHLGLLRVGPTFTVALLRTFIYLLVGYAITRLVSELRARNASLQQANHQLASYTDTLEQLAISRERNRLARELHDTLAHTLSAVAVQLEAVNSLWQSDPGQAHGMLDHSLQLTRDGLGETRRAIQALRTAPLDDLGLSLSLSNLARSVAERNGLKLDLRVPEDIPGLDPQVEHSLYRIAEEGLHNVDQHANASSLYVAMERNGKGWILTIQDDGSGFEYTPEANGEHFGLQGIREYAEAIGATIDIHSQPGAGTQIRLVLKDRKRNDKGADL